MPDPKSNATQRQEPAAEPSPRPKLNSQGTGGPHRGRLLSPDHDPEAEQPQSSTQAPSNSRAESASCAEAAEPLPVQAVAGQEETTGRPHGKNSTRRAKSRSRRHLKARVLRKGASEARQKLMLGLIPVLAIALVFAVKNPMKASAVPLEQSAPSDNVARSTVLDTDINWEIPPLYVPGSRDPMQLPAPPVAPGGEEMAGPPTPVQTRVELAVTGILYSVDRPAAIVDTRLVHEGEQVSGATVKKIEMDGVEFEMNGQTWKQAVDKQ